MESFSHFIKVILLLAVFAVPQNTLGLPSSSPSPVFQKTKELRPSPEITTSDVNQRPQVQPGVIVAQDERDYYNVINQNTRPTQQITRQEFQPQVLPAGPDQPSSDILPPPESLDQDFFVNVKTKPTQVDSSSSNLKTKRDNSNEDDLNVNAQQPMARFLLPGLNINWGGGEMTSITESLDCPSASPIAPTLLHCGLKECSEDSECFGERKCCRYACALICVDPVKKPSSSVISSTHYISKDPGQNSLELPPIISTGVGNQGNNNNNNYEKPGSCYRPNNNYYVGSGYNNNNGYRNDYNNNFGRVKRQTNFGSSSFTPYSNNQFGYPGYNNNNNGGWQGGNNPGNNAGGWQGGNGIGSGYQQCYRDSDCSGTLKCCNRQCRTPAYFG